SSKTTPGARVRRQMRDVIAREMDRPAIRTQLSGELRNQRRLAGAIRTDDRVQTAPRHSEINRVICHKAAEPLREARGGKERIAHLVRLLSVMRPSTPRLPTSTRITRIAPTKPGQ